MNNLFLFEIPGVLNGTYYPGEKINKIIPRISTPLLKNLITTLNLLSTLPSWDIALGPYSRKLVDIETFNQLLLDFGAEKIVKTIVPITSSNYQTSIYDFSLTYSHKVILTAKGCTVPRLRVTSCDQNGYTEDILRIVKSSLNLRLR